MTHDAMVNAFRMTVSQVPVRRPIPTSAVRALIFFLALCPGPWTLATRGSDAPDLVGRWISAQTNFQTWSADVTQVRTLKTLAEPLVAQGRVWFAAPNQFRWELFKPAPTIAVRQPEQMLIIYPKLKRAERYPLRGDQAGPWKDALALLEAGFPRSTADLEGKFKVLSQTSSNDVCEVVLQPKSASARRMMPKIKLALGSADLSLRATELQFADGSTMRNEFSNARLNPKLDDDLFTPKVASDFQVTEPLKR